MQDRLPAALWTKPYPLPVRPGQCGVALRLLEIGGEADAAALGRRRVHELSDGGENGGDGLIVGSELFIEPSFELVEAPGEIFVRGEQFAQLARRRARRRRPSRRRAGLFSTLAAWIAPCSVKAQGSSRRPPRLGLEVAICDFKVGDTRRR